MLEAGLGVHGVPDHGEEHGARSQGGGGLAGQVRAGAILRDAEGGPEVSKVSAVFDCEDMTPAWQCACSRGCPTPRGQRSRRQSGRPARGLQCDTR